MHTQDHSRAPRAAVDIAGYALVILAAFCYSTLGIFGKVAFREGMSLTSLLSIRFVLAAAVLWGLVLSSPRLRAEAAGAGGRRTGLFLWGVLGLAGQAGLFFGALHFIPASMAEVLLYTCPAFLAIVLWVRNRRRPATTVLAAIALALAGTWLVAAPAVAGLSAFGILLGLGSGAWFASFLLALERASTGVHPFVSTTFIVTGAAVSYVVVTPLAGGFALPASSAAWRAVLGMVLVPTLCGFFFFIIGLRRTGPQVASVLSTFEPVGTLALAALLLGERLRPGQWVGAVLVLVAAFVLAVRPGPDAETPAGRRIDRPEPAA